jgi:hypothetical protein
MNIDAAFASPRQSAVPVSSPFARRKGTLPLIVAALLILALGMAVGAAATVFHFRGLALSDATPAETICHMITSKVSGSVSITPAEEAEIRGIVESDIADAVRLRREFTAEIKQRLGTMRNKICNILGPERAELCGYWMSQGGVESLIQEERGKVSP